MGSPEEPSLLHSCEVKVIESHAQAQLACCLPRFAALVGPPHRCQTGSPGPHAQSSQLHSLCATSQKHFQIPLLLSSPLPQGYILQGAPQILVSHSDPKYPWNSAWLQGPPVMTKGSDIFLQLLMAPSNSEVPPQQSFIFPNGPLEPPYPPASTLSSS